LFAGTAALRMMASELADTPTMGASSFIGSKGILYSAGLMVSWLAVENSTV